MGESHPLIEPTRKKYNLARALVRQDIEKQQKKEQRKLNNEKHPLQRSPDTSQSDRHTPIIRNPKTVQRSPDCKVLPSIVDNELLPLAKFTLFGAENPQTLVTEKLGKTRILRQPSVLSEENKRLERQDQQYIRSIFRVATTFGNNNQYSIDTLGEFSDKILPPFHDERNHSERKAIKNECDNDMIPFLVKVVEDDDFLIDEEESGKGTSTNGSTTVKILSEWLENPQLNIGPLFTASSAFIQVKNKLDN